ncbi:MAG: hypothetical protein HFI20_06450 [Lachnospiraceae bacterium]|nr:hypothetical protein [Lachnospiraceae bacterium]
MEGNQKESKAAKNWEAYEREYALSNHLGASIKGRIYDQINSYKGKVFCYPVRDDADIKPGDIVMLDRYCEAFPLGMFFEMDKEEYIYSQLIGQAVVTAYANQCQKMVFVRECCVFKFDNTLVKENVITPNDVGSPCYLEDPFTVTKDDDFAFAGQITGIEEKNVYVYVTLGKECEAYGN